MVSTAGEKITGADHIARGPDRIVRRTMEAVGHPVRRLSRIGIGPVRLGNLAVGKRAS